MTLDIFKKINSLILKNNIKEQPKIEEKQEDEHIKKDEAEYYLSKVCLAECLLNIYKKSNKEYRDINIKYNNSLTGNIYITDDTYIEIINYNNASSKVNKSFNYFIIIYLTIYIHGIKVLETYIGFENNRDLERILDEDKIDGYNQLLFNFLASAKYTYATYDCYYDIPNWFLIEIKNMYDRIIELSLNPNSYNQNKINQKIYVEKDEKKQVCYLLSRYLDEYLKDEEVKSLSENAKVACYKILKDYISPILNDELTNEEIEKNLDEITKELKLIEIKNN